MEAHSGTDRSRRYRQGWVAVMEILIGLAIGIGLLCLAGLIPTKPRRVSRLSEEERLAWVEHDRLAWMEKERQAKALSLHLPGGRFDRSDPS
jgi:hypothetical protein